MSPVSTPNSRLIYDALKACGIRLVSAPPETWLVHLIRMAEVDPDMTLVPACQGGVTAFDEALAAGELSSVVAKVDAVGPSAFVTDLGLLENRFQFQRYLTHGDADRTR